MNKLLAQIMDSYLNENALQHLSFDFYLSYDSFQYVLIQIQICMCVCLFVFFKSSTSAFIKITTGNVLKILCMTLVRAAVCSATSLLAITLDSLLAPKKYNIINNEKWK